MAKRLTAIPFHLQFTCFGICQIIVNCKYPFWDFPLNLRLFTALSALDELNKCGINRAYACIVCGTKLPHKSLLTQLGDNLPRLGTPTEHLNNIWKYLVHIGYAKYFYQCLLLQVNLCQNLLLMHQLTHNMTTDCSLNYQFSKWKLQAQSIRGTFCVHKLFWISKQKQKTICIHNKFWACSFHVLNW